MKSYHEDLINSETRTALKNIEQRNRNVTAHILEY